MPDPIFKLPPNISAGKFVLCLIAFVAIIAFAVSALFWDYVLDFHIPLVDSLIYAIAVALVANKIQVVPAEEELQIAYHCRAMMRQQQ